MRDLEILIKEWESAADNDGKPPVITEEERQALAHKYLNILGQRKRIHGFPIFGLSEAQHVMAQQLDQRMGVVFNFLRETLSDKGWVPDSVALGYIQQVKTRKPLVISCR